MKKLWPYLFLLATILVFFHPFVMKYFLPIPSDTIVGLYHPFRDMFAKNYPRGIPFKNFLITDPVRQQIPWKSLAVSLEKQFQLPLWNPYSFGGYPLLGNFQTGAFYPLNILFFLLPFSFAWSIFILLQPILGGISLYVYLRNVKLHPLASILGGVAFAFSGFSVVWLEWGNVMHTLLWLPILLLAIDKIFVYRRSKIAWYSIYFLALIFSFLAGHLQMFFYMVVLVHVYLFLRWYLLDRTLKPWYWGVSFAMGALVLTSIQWIPTLQFILHSARNMDQNYLTTEGWFLPYQHLLQFIIPDFFGNPATLNYWGVWNYAEFVGYIGILPLLFALFATFFRHDKKTWFFAGMTLGALLFALPTPLGIVPFVLHIPFLSTSQPTRLIGIVDFCLPVLAALGLDAFMKKKIWAILWIVGLFVVVFITLWLIVLKIHLGISEDHIAIARRNMVFPSLFFFGSVLIILSGILFRFRKWILYFGIVILVLTSADLVRFGDKFTPFTSSTYLFPQEKTLSYLQQHIGNNRFMTTDARILAPNFSVMYHLQSLDGYDPLYLTNYAELIAAIERGRPDIHTPFGFNRIITPHNYNSPLFDLLGVKYILSLDELYIPKLKQVYQEGETRVYENAKVLPRAFFVTRLIPATSNQDGIEKLFANQAYLTDTATIGYTGPIPVLSSGKVRITSYNPNEVILTTENTGEGFMVLTDVSYPGWKATIDGKSVNIYTTDYAFRGIFVSKGRHIIVFSDHIF